VHVREPAHPEFSHARARPRGRPTAARRLGYAAEMTFEIRPMTASDVEASAAAVLAGGWGDRSKMLRFAVGAGDWQPYVAVGAGTGAIVGTGLAARQGPVGWVGLIWTAPEARGQGIGSAVTRRVVEDLRGRGCLSIALIASTLGRPVYERLGFRSIGREPMLRAGAGGLAEPGDNAPVRRFSASDLDAAAALDREATGEDRRLLLSAAPSGFVAETAGAACAGSCCGRRSGNGRGTVARDIGTALALHRAAGPCGLDERLGFTARNGAGLAAMLADGWEDDGGGTRMILGPEPDWRPEMCFGDSAFATGEPASGAPASAASPR